jgi:hypothetical protein
MALFLDYTLATRVRDELLFGHIAVRSASPIAHAKLMWFQTATSSVECAFNAKVRRSEDTKQSSQGCMAMHLT